MLTKEEIENLATLSKLSLTEEEYPKLCEDLQKMVDFADIVRNADLSEYDFKETETFPDAFREDRVGNSLSREQILSNAPLCDEKYFVVRKRG